MLRPLSHSEREQLDRNLATRLNFYHPDPTRFDAEFDR